MIVPFASGLVFFFNDTATTEIYTLSLHDALPISPAARVPPPVALTKLVLAGMVSVITTPVAFMLPGLQQFSRYLMLLPATTGSGASVLLMFMTGADDTVVVTAAPLVGAVCALSML